MAEDDPRYEVRDAIAEKLLLDIGRLISRTINNSNYNFCFFLFGRENKSMFYISDAERDSIIEALEQFISNQKAGRENAKTI